LTSAPAVAVAGVHVEIRPINPVMFGQMRRDHIGRIDAARAPPALDFRRAIINSSISRAMRARS
jgi:hypothetical protein